MRCNPDTIQKQGLIARTIILAPWAAYLLTGGPSAALCHPPGECSLSWLRNPAPLESPGRKTIPVHPPGSPTPMDVGDSPARPCRARASAVLDVRLVLECENHIRVSDLIKVREDFRPGPVLGWRHRGMSATATLLTSFQSSANKIGRQLIPINVRHHTDPTRCLGEDDRRLIPASQVFFSAKCQSD